MVAVVTATATRSSRSNFICTSLSYAFPYTYDSVKCAFQVLTPSSVIRLSEIRATVHSKIHHDDHFDEIVVEARHSQKDFALCESSMYRALKYLEQILSESNDGSLKIIICEWVEKHRQNVLDVVITATKGVLPLIFGTAWSLIDLVQAEISTDAAELRPGKKRRTEKRLLDEDVILRDPDFYLSAALDKFLNISTESQQKSMPMYLRKLRQWTLYPNASTYEHHGIAKVEDLRRYSVLRNWHSRQSTFSDVLSTHILKAQELRASLGDARVSSPKQIQQLWLSGIEDSIRAELGDSYDDRRKKSSAHEKKKDNSEAKAEDLLWVHAESWGRKAAALIMRSLVNEETENLAHFPAQQKMTTKRTLSGDSDLSDGKRSPRDVIKPASKRSRKRQASISSEDSEVAMLGLVLQLATLQRKRTWQDRDSSESEDGEDANIELTDSEELVKVKKLSIIDDVDELRLPESNTGIVDVPLDPISILPVTLTEQVRVEILPIALDADNSKLLHTEPEALNVIQKTKRIHRRSHAMKLRRRRRAQPPRKRFRTDAVRVLTAMGVISKASLINHGQLASPPLFAS